MLIAGLTLVVLSLLTVNINLTKRYNRAYETACALSDIVRIHLDSPYSDDCGFRESYEDYASELKELNYQHIKELKLDKYVWCY